MSINKKPAVCVVGVGLIGGSIALALTRHDFASRIIGVDVSDEVLVRARNRNVIDEATSDLAEGVAKADIVVLSMPVKSIIEAIKTISAMNAGSLLIIDTGSTKVEVVSAAQKAAIGRWFVGGHPMAGMEKSGVENARADLFDNSVFFLAPGEMTELSQLALAENFVSALGAMPVEITPEEHDRAVAYSSHLPYILSLALTGTVVQATKRHPATLSGLAGGFRDCTRLAAGSVNMWVDILRANTVNINEALDAFKTSLEEIICAVRSGESTELSGLLARIRAQKKTLQQV